MSEQDRTTEEELEVKAVGTEGYRRVGRAMIDVSAMEIEVPDPEEVTPA